MGQPIGVGVEFAIVALPIGIFLPVWGVFQGFLPLVEFEPKVRDLVWHLMVEIFLF